MKDLQRLEEKYKALGYEIEALKREQTNKPEHRYPIFAKSRTNSLVVEFDSLKNGGVLVGNGWYNYGNIDNNFVPHTDTDVWQILKVCPKTGYFDGQLVWCWDNEYTHKRELRFWDATNSIAFVYNGSRYGNKYDNHSPYEGEWPKWAVKAFQTLKLD